MKPVSVSFFYFEIKKDCYNINQQRVFLFGMDKPSGGRVFVSVLDVPNHREHQI